MKYVNKLVKKLLEAPLYYEEFDNILQKSDRFFESIELEKQLLLQNGFPLSFEDETVSLKTLSTKIEDQTFCIVDIETSGGNPKKSQMIEIGAIKLKNGQIVEKYESLVNTYDIPKNIQELTGITPEMTHNAPSIQTVLEEFKIFLEDDVFVAHDINFDYKFISDSMRKYDLGELCNRKLCTINLSKKLIEIERYGLKYLKEHLEIDEGSHHRAYSDAYCTTMVFLECLKRLPNDVITSEDLIRFSLESLRKNKSNNSF
jgi:DNA polymerase III subunit epsilon